MDCEADGVGARVEEFSSAKASKGGSKRGRAARRILQRYDVVRVGRRIKGGGSRIAWDCFRSGGFND